VFSADDPYIGIDLDGCRDPVSGTIAPWAWEIINKLNTYAEVSVSGTGVHLLAKGELPPGGRKKGGIEIYKLGRYFTTTGHRVPGTPLELHERQDEVEALHTEVFGPQEHLNANGNGRASNGYVPPSLSDTELLAKAFAARNGQSVSRLYLGDISSYPSASEADLALVSHLAFYAGPDPARIDRLFRGSALFRPQKWDEKHYGNGATYGQHTILAALAGRKDFYGDNGNGAAVHSKAPITDEEIIQTPMDYLTTDVPTLPDEVWTG